MLKDDAEALRVSLAAGYASVADVVAWADRVIAAGPAPDPVFFDLSVSRGRAIEAVAELLAAVPGEPTPHAAVRRLVGSMLARVRSNPASAPAITKELYQLATTNQLPEEVFGVEAFVLDDNWYLESIGVLHPGVTALGALTKYLTQHAAAPEG